MTSTGLYTRWVELRFYSLPNAAKALEKANIRDLRPSGVVTTTPDWQSHAWTLLETSLSMMNLEIQSFTMGIVLGFKRFKTALKHTVQVGFSIASV